MGDSAKEGAEYSSGISETRPEVRSILTRCKATISRRTAGLDRRETSGWWCFSGFDAAACRPAQEPGPYLLVDAPHACVERLA